MDATIKQALVSERTVDITTTGRKSGEPSRIEIWFHNVDGRVFITGRPGRRDWYANLLADPQLTFHLKQSVRADLPATARPVVDSAEKRRVLEAILERIADVSEIDRWMAGSPLVEVAFD